MVVERVDDPDSEAGVGLWVSVAMLAPLIFAPSSIPPLIAPIFFILLLMWFSRDGSVLRIVAIGIVVSAFSLVSILTDFQVFGRTVSVPAFLFGVLHYLPIVVALGLISPRVGWRTRDRCVMLVAWLTVVECAIGVGQFAIFGFSDAVSGTMGFLGPPGPPGMDQILLTFNLFCAMLFLAPYVGRSLVATLAIILAAVAIALAQSGHQTLLFAVSLAASSLISRRIQFETFLGGVIIVAIILGLVIAIHPRTFTIAKGWYEVTIDPDRSLKLAIVMEGAEVLASPKNLVLGVGLGQFASRSALVASEDWVNLDLPDPLTGKSDYFRLQVEPLIVSHRKDGAGSSISQPYFSILNLIVELGVVLVGIFFVVVVRFVRRNVLLQESSNAEVRRLAWVLNAGIIFFFLVSFIENYAEFVQAMFLPVLLLVVANGRIRAMQSLDSVSRVGDTIGLTGRYVSENHAADGRTSIA